MQPDQSQEASATARGARGTIGLALSDQARIGNGDAAVATPGSDVRDRPQDWLSGI